MGKCDLKTGNGKVYWENIPSSINATGICFDDDGMPIITRRSVSAGKFDGVVLAGVEQTVKVSRAWELIAGNQVATERSSLALGQTILSLKTGPGV